MYCVREAVCFGGTCCLFLQDYDNFARPKDAPAGTQYSPYIAVTIGIKIFRRLATVYGTLMTYRAVCLWALGFVFLFTIAGPIGVVLANSSIDIVLHDTLCSSTLPLRTINRCGICNYSRICPMIPTIHWTYNKPKMFKDSICCYICGGKLNILSTTFSRPSRNAAARVRLSRRLQHMKYHLISMINNFIRKCNDI